MAQEPAADDEIVVADIRDVEALEGACDGAAAVVHLAGEPAEAEFRTRLLPSNLDGTWAALEAATRTAVGRFVFASTIQTMLGHPAERLVSPDDEPRPISVYACTKLFGEALARYHADRSGLGVTCLRLGAIRQRDSADLRPEHQLAGVWIGADDLARLIGASIHSAVPFATVLAVSPPATTRFDTRNPFAWTPEELPQPDDVEGVGSPPS